MSEGLAKIDELIKKVKEVVGEQVPPSKPPEKKEPEKKPGEKPPEKKPEGGEEMDEALGIPKRRIRAAKAEFESFNEFLDLYADGDEKAFQKPVIETDDPLLERVSERPPKAWFDKCVRENPEADDPAALCGWIWYHWLTPAERERLKGSE